jgi:hypothetical protein
VKFAKLFGYEMKELDRLQQKKTGAARTATQSDPTKEYVLKSMVITQIDDTHYAPCNLHVTYLINPGSD